MRQTNDYHVHLKQLLKTGFIIWVWIFILSRHSNNTIGFIEFEYSCWVDKATTKWSTSHTHTCKYVFKQKKCFFYLFPEFTNVLMVLLLSFCNYSNHRMVIIMNYYFMFKFRKLILILIFDFHLFWC